MTDMDSRVALVPAILFLLTPFAALVSHAGLVPTLAVMTFEGFFAWRMGWQIGVRT